MIKSVNSKKNIEEIQTVQRKRKGIEPYWNNSTEEKKQNQIFVLLQIKILNYIALLKLG